MEAALHERFATHGVIPLRGFHPKARLAPLRQRLLDEIRRLSTNAAASKALRRLPVFQQVTTLSSSVKVPGVEDVLVTPELTALIAELGGTRPSPRPPTQLLLSPPNQGDGATSRLNWHVDVAADPRGPVPGVQAFFLIDDVAPRGGATLALAGSHVLGANRPQALARVREVLRTGEDPAGEVEAAGLEIVEMCGRAGDVFLMDMRVLHTPSVNGTKQPRRMATCRCLTSHPPSRSG